METVFLRSFKKKKKLSYQNAFVLTGSNADGLPYFQPVDIFKTQSPRIRCVILSCSFHPHSTCLGFSKWFPYKKIINQNLQQGVPGVKENTSGFKSRAGAESKAPCTHGSKTQRFLSHEFLKYINL